MLDKSTELGPKAEAELRTIVSAIKGVANFVLNDLLQKQPHETAHYP